MSLQQRYEQLINRVSKGETIVEAAENVFGSYHKYHVSIDRAKRSIVREVWKNYLLVHPRKVERNRVELKMHPETYRAVKQHCKTLGVPVSQFITSALTTALNKAK